MIEAKIPSFSTELSRSAVIRWHSINAKESISKQRADSESESIIHFQVIIRVRVCYAIGLDARFSGRAVTSGKTARRSPTLKLELFMPVIQVSLLNRDLKRLTGRLTRSHGSAAGESCLPVPQ